MRNQSVAETITDWRGKVAFRCSRHVVQIQCVSDSCYDSVRREVFYKFLIEFGIPRKCKVNKVESD